MAITRKTTNPWICTYNGHEIDLLNPRPSDIDHIDIAHALSLINRFTGHTGPGWSVGQHSIVGSILAEFYYPEVKWLPHEYLFHDATEAYLGDVSSPLKSLLPEYRAIEAKHQAAIEMKFALSLGGQWIKTVDLRMLATERDFFLPETATQWNVEMEPFTYEGFIATEKAFELKLPMTFWEYLWTPWTPEETEQRFLDRMEKLEI